MCHRALVIALVSFLVIITPAASFSQSAVTGNDSKDSEALNRALTSPDAVKELIARMSDEEVREILISQLSDAQSEGSVSRDTPAASLTEIIESLLIGPFRSVVDAVSKLPLIFSAQIDAISQFWASHGTAGVVQGLVLVLVAILAGLVAQWGVSIFARNWRGVIQKMAHEDASLIEKLKGLGIRLGLDAMKLAAFYVVVRALISTLIAPADLALTRTTIVYVVFMPMVIAAITRFVLAPDEPMLRLVNSDNATARYLQRNIFLITTFIGFALALLNFNKLNGVEPHEIRLGFWLNLVAFIWIGAVIVKARQGFIMIMRGFGSDLTPIEDGIARAYPRFALTAVIGCWLFGEALIAAGRAHLIMNGEHLITLAILLAAPALDTLIRALVNNFAPEMSGEGLQAETAHATALKSYIRIGRIVALGIILGVIAEIWGFDAGALISGDTPNLIAAGLFRFASILLVGYLLMEIVALWFNSQIANERTAAGQDLTAEEPGGGEGGGAGASRMSTVLPLISWFLQTAILVLTVLIAISNLGVDVTPLLAGAGIVGIAIGFGAQKIVTDVVSGLFFLIDDAFRIGEYVEVEGTRGTIEKISTRSLQLRHHRGPVHTIPYGEIPKITNYSRDWVMMKLLFTVPFDTDLMQVKKIFKKIGKDMMEVPEFAEDFLEPFKSQGVFEVNDLGIVIRGKFMAKPGRQFVLRKEIYARVQKAFEEVGIQFARREVRVKVDTPEGMTFNEEQKAKLSAAASDTVAQDQLKASKA